MRHAACLIRATHEGENMGRKNRHAPPGVAHHVVNRANDRQTIFRYDFDYAAFIELLGLGVRDFAVQCYGYCLMPNHFHLLVEPLEHGALSAFMQAVTGGYACAFRRETGTVGHGHVFQRRFWNAAAHDENAFVANLRYIEANPVRAGLVSDADLWPWSSFGARQRNDRTVLAALPIELPAGWPTLVNQPQSRETTKRIRQEMKPCPGRPRKNGGDGTSQPGL
jgi:putative transposase